MKQVKLVNVSNPDKTSNFKRNRLYWIALGNGISISFSNFKETELYLTYINDFLNRRLFMLNELYIEVFIHFRRNWFYFENLYAEERTCQNAFDDIDKFLKLMIERCGYTNGNHFVFNYFFFSFEKLKVVIEILQELHQKRNNWAEIKILAVLIARIDYIVQEMNELGSLKEIPDYKKKQQNNKDR